MESSLPVNANGTEQAVAWLDRPLIPGVRISRSTVIYLCLMGFIVFTRLWDLGSRSYSHDESIHAWEAWKLFSGRGYTHSPVYHGPFLYHVTALVYALFGDTDVTARLATSLAGIALAFVPLAMRRWLGTRGMLMATLLMAISPVLMHRSRYIRHDQFTIVFNLILIVASLRYLEDRKPAGLYAIAAALSLGFTGKETTFILYAILGTFLAGLLAYEWLTSRNRHLRALMQLPLFDLIVLIGTLILPFASPLVVQLLGRNPVDYTPGGMAVSLGIAVVMFGIGAGIGLWWNPRVWILSAGIFWGIFFPFFTTMFTNGRGVATGVVGQLGYWLSQHGETRGGQPWHYYLVLIAVYEFLPALLSLGGLVHFARRGDTLAQRRSVRGERPAPFLPFLAYWLLTSIAVYSWAGEKMPWLLLHIAVPMTLLGGWALAHLVEMDWRGLVRQHGVWLLFLIPLELLVLGKLATLRPSLGTSSEQLYTTMLWLVTLATGLGLGALIGSILGRQRPGDGLRLTGLALMVPLAAFTLRTALVLSFVNGDSARELMVYAQGAPETGIIARDLEDLSRRLTGGLDLSVAHDSETSWPFVWYLRNYPNATYFGKAPSGPLDADIVLVGVSNEEATKPFLAEGYTRSEHRLIWWPYQDWYMQMTPASLWKDLTSAEGRTELWKILASREWPRALSDWPYEARFAMYTSPQVAGRLWQGAPLALGQSHGEADAYLDRWVDRSALLAIGQSGSGNGQLNAPKGIALDAQGNLYVADSQNHRVQVFDPQGQFVRSMGSQGSELGQLQEPWGVAVCDDGTVYVADTWNHRVQAFDSAGNPLLAWGIFGQPTEGGDQAHTLYGPRSIVCDEQNNIYITDTGNKRVLKYTGSGELIASVGSPGTGNAQFLEPVGLALDDTGRL
ncbi:MAG: TIGR03663 family protein, partial [Chloroflexi bacterium]|nr:TIGR03663 family protein [Chloroflexota bacterium]